MAFVEFPLFKVTILCLETDETDVIYVATDEHISEALKIAEEYCDKKSGVHLSYLVVKIKYATNGLVCVELLE